MPDPILYLKASIAVVFASTLVVLALRLIIGKSARSFAGGIGVLGIGAGLLVGYTLLQFAWTWPPANGLNRLLLIVLPAAAMLEFLAAVFAAPDRVFAMNVSPQIATHEAPKDVRKRTSRLQLLVVVSRLILSAAAGRILLHDSVYLGGIASNNPEAWTFMQMLLKLGCGSVGLIVVGTLLTRLSARDTSCSVAFSLVMAILSTGLSIMLAGYIKGGVAAIPLAAALAGATAAAFALKRYCDNPTVDYLQGATRIGLVGLFGFVCIGHYFGQLTGPRAFVLFLTPLLCWISELPGLRSMSSRQKSAIQLIAVIISLATVVYFARCDFDAKMAPLLAVVTAPDAYQRLLQGLSDSVVDPAVTPTPM